MKLRVYLFINYKFLTTICHTETCFKHAATLKIVERHSSELVNTQI